MSSRCPSHAMSKMVPLFCCEKLLFILEPGPEMLRPLGHIVFVA